jgi:uncharacterized YigZ family protein
VTDGGYAVPSGGAEAETVIEKSRFIAYAGYAETEEDAAAVLKRLRREHPSASHICYAYRLCPDGGVRSSDGGEPPGTAGVPILEALRGQKLFNAVAAVTRYFGGVKLGTGGLARAYTESALKAMRLCAVKTVYPSALFRLNAPYAGASALLACVRKYGEPTEIRYGGGVEIDGACPESRYAEFCEKIRELTNGKLIPETAGRAAYAFRGGDKEAF